MNYVLVASTTLNVDFTYNINKFYFFWIRLQMLSVAWPLLRTRSTTLNVDFTYNIDKFKGFLEDWIADFELGWGPLSTTCLLLTFP